LTSLSLALLFGRGGSTSVMKGVTSSEVPATEQTESAAPAAPPAGNPAPADTEKK
jgi:hypothetical protein